MSPTRRGRQRTQRVSSLFFRPHEDNPMQAGDARRDELLRFANERLAGRRWTPQTNLDPEGSLSTALSFACELRDREAGFPLGTTEAFVTVLFDRQGKSTSNNDLLAEVLGNVELMVLIEELVGDSAAPLKPEHLQELEALLREARGLACLENDGSAPCKMPGGPCWEHRRRDLIARIDEIRTR